VAVSRSRGAVGCRGRDPTWTRRDRSPRAPHAIRLFPILAALPRPCVEPYTPPDYHIGTRPTLHIAPAPLCHTKPSYSESRAPTPPCRRETSSPAYVASLTLLAEIAIAIAIALNQIDSLLRWGSTGSSSSASLRRATCGSRRRTPHLHIHVAFKQLVNELLQRGQLLAFRDEIELVDEVHVMLETCGRHRSSNSNSERRHRRVQWPDRWDCLERYT
jgi:hypothetical protein